MFKRELARLMLLINQAALGWKAAAQGTYHLGSLVGQWYYAHEDEILDDIEDTLETARLHYEYVKPYLSRASDAAVSIYQRTTNSPQYQALRGVGKDLEMYVIEEVLDTVSAYDRWRVDELPQLLGRLR